MKPLKLVFTNSNHGNENDLRFTKMIYKKGDDLRQDMLIIQMFQVIESIWQADGLDLVLTPYKIIQTGYHRGLMEFVDNAITISRIQTRCTKTTLATLSATFDEKLVYEHICKKHAGMVEREWALEEFNKSLAAYTIATYILGIADRHPSNIMLKDNGQLFHIDFGHILGNFKTKGGIKRERVKFVMPEVFVYVIKQCKANNRHGRHPFDEFKALCEQGYMSLRKKGDFLMALFRLMLTAGLPQVKSAKNIEYIREQLQLNQEQTPEQARRHLNKIIEDSRKMSTGLNWFAHNIVQQK